LETITKYGAARLPVQSGTVSVPDGRFPMVMALLLLAALACAFGLPPTSPADQRLVAGSRATVSGLLLGSSGEQAVLRSPSTGGTGLGTALGRGKPLRSKAAGTGVAGSGRQPLGLRTGQEPVVLLGSDPARLRAPPSPALVPIR
jgi:hypothetical protein